MLIMIRIETIIRKTNFQEMKDTLLIRIAGVLVMFMQPGFAMVEAGCDVVTPGGAVPPCRDHS